MSEPPAPHEGSVRDWVLTASALHRLLDWLDGGVSSGGHGYLEMRGRLKAYFERKNCPTPDDLADETLTRVARRLEEEGVTQDEAPARYCYIVARFVFLEHLRQIKKHQTIRDDSLRNDTGPPDAIVDTAAREKMHACLDRCIESLDPLNRRLITKYYIGSEREKIENRRALAASLGLTVNAVSIRACRIRTRLETCVRRCMREGMKGFRHGGSSL